MRFYHENYQSFFEYGAEHKKNGCTFKIPYKWVTIKTRNNVRTYFVSYFVGQYMNKDMNIKIANSYYYH